MDAAIKHAKMSEKIMAKSLDLSCNVRPWNLYGISFSIGLSTQDGHPKSL
jgi:hypothetical protein